MTRSTQPKHRRRHAKPKNVREKIPRDEPNDSIDSSKAYHSASEESAFPQDTFLVDVESSDSSADSSVSSRSGSPSHGQPAMKILSKKSDSSPEDASDFSGLSDTVSEGLFLPVSGSESPEPLPQDLDLGDVLSKVSASPQNSSSSGSASPEVEAVDSEASDDFQDLDSESEEIEIVSVAEVPQNKKFLRKRSKHVSEKSNVKRVKPTIEPDSASESSPTDSEFSRIGSDHDSSSSDESISIDSESKSLVARARRSSKPGRSKTEKSAAKLIAVDESEDSEASSYATGNISDVVVIDSEAESEGEEDKSSQRDGPRSSVHLLKSLSDRVTNEKKHGINTDAVSMHELIGASDLIETYQFNFSVDVEYFLTFLHKDFVANNGKICFITGSPVLSGHPLQKLFSKKFNISEAIAPLPHRYASHHSKMMVNVFDNSEVEIVIMTSNLTQLDLGGLSQSVWRSGRLSNGSTKTKVGKRFRFDLMRYLSRYGIQTTKLIMAKIEKLDFSPVNVELVASAPGSYDLQNIKETSEAYGFAKLRQVLERNDLLISDKSKKHNVLSQVTSIASPYICQKGEASSVFSHLLCPLMFTDWETLKPGGESFVKHQKSFNYKPHYIFPRIKDIAESSFGYMSGSAVHFNYTGTSAQEKQYEQNIKRYLYKWKTSGNITGREHLTPHSKYYVCDNGDNWDSLKWVLVGSHNLSKQAWGYPVAKSNGSRYDVSSYELSVLIPGGPSLVPSYKSDYLSSADEGTVPVRLPFALPPSPYSSADLPWSNSADCGQRRDRYGNTYRGHP